MTPEPSPLPRIAPPAASKRRRGGQPGNHNARAHGHYSRLAPSSNFLSDLRYLKRGLYSHALPLQLALASVIAQRDRLDEKLDQATDQHEYIALLDLRFKLSSIHTRLLREFAAIARPRIELLQQARDPLSFIRSTFNYHGITRDADSFASSCSAVLCRCDPAAADMSLDPTHSDSDFCSFKVQAGEATPSPELVSPALEHPAFALTDEQWAILAPLLPPDPADDHYSGDPPALIAANRWQFVHTVPNRRLSSAALRQYRRLTPRHIYHEEPLLRRTRAGRPSFSPRPVLDAIFYKLSTGCSWTEFPASGHPARIADTQPVGAECPVGYPSWRTCQVYYRRLFNSGRLYTLLLALYHDLRQRSGVNLVSLVESGQLALDDRGKVIPTSSEPLTWEIQTALLFLQLAHAGARVHNQPSDSPYRPSHPQLSRSRRPYHSFFSTRTKSTLNSRAVAQMPRVAENEQVEPDHLIPWSPGLGPPFGLGGKKSEP